jgi:hypothetical protein
MRLLHTNTMKLSEPDPIPPYAILSHTWDGNEHEVTFQDMQNVDLAKEKKGYKKIKKCCQLAESHGFDYVWVDTCCINKDSSAELSEAVNSMYLWYRKASLCYVYLSDLLKPNSPLFGARWFTRGWTLQELVAPTSSIFYDNEWREIGTKASLKNHLSYITRVPPGVLESSNRLDTISVAKKMSWASNRVTTKGEDLAYSLMGIFNVNMPILYGEGGEKAFARLQQEIWKVVEDPSIFAWLGNEGAAKRGLLAHYPVEFACMGDVQVDLDGFYKSFNISDTVSHSYMTNRGLLINLPLQNPATTMLDNLLGLFMNQSPRKQTFIRAALPCKINDKFLVISLANGERGQYVRVKSDRFEYLDSNSCGSYTVRSVYVNEEKQPENQPQGGQFEVAVESDYSGFVSAWSLKNSPPSGQTFHIDVQNNSSEGFFYDVYEGAGDEEQVEFAVVLGIHQSVAWTEVVAGIEQHQQAKWVAQEVAKQSSHTDRAYVKLGNALGVHVSITKLGFDYLAKVSVKRCSADNNEPRTLLPLTPKCILFCKFRGDIDSFDILPHPMALWRQNNIDSHMHLFVTKNSEITTYLEVHSRLT